ncbi:hypothetical protein CKAN_01239500 [Cinnamomum micranthum f. kanehirae]|uniref:Uncharacterized protein n=1 Tax=Cinnamomum micranthum f. kanehirae TaxID=337451 RepID=A0A443NYM1_9MAGN|nr:hypothetical protein CKAN_01239500 [Cinnamomum micranthum f. kanehirae]
MSSPSGIKRRNSISSIIPTTLHLPSAPRSQSLSFPTADFELASLRPLPPSSYTSLKDILPTSPGIQSPTASQICQEISIRNRLVKQAAWAYLQPMASSPGSSSSSGTHQFLRRIWVSFSSAGFLGFLRHPFFHAIRTAFTRLLGVFSFGIGRSR